MPLEFPYIEVHGSHREIGRQIGEGARERVTAALAYYQENYEDLAGVTLAEGKVQAMAAYLPAARAFSPELTDQLEGLAEGAGVAFDDLFLLNCGEEFTCPPDRESAVGGPGSAAAAGGPASTATDHCTSLAIMTRSRHIAAHNEDWYPGDAANMVLVRATLPGGRRYLSMTAAAYLPFTGMTSAGTACSANTLYATDYRQRGVPNQFIVASLLLSADLESARARVAYADRGRGSNHLLADVHGRIWNIETSATAWQMIEGDSWYAHTNHYVDSRMQQFEGSTSEGSRLRLARACELIRSGVQRRDDPLKLATAVLSDHANGSASICSHPDPADPPAERSMTTASMIWDLDERRLHVCAGPPCENERRTFTL
jgi:isopenicillin-N N-acyltransferase-like protein